VVTVVGVALLVVAGVGAGSVAFNAAAYAGASLHRRRHAPACPFDDDDAGPWPARALAWLRAFAVECAVTAALVLSVPLSLRRQRVRPLDGDDARRPVVFVHGYAQHAANFVWLVRRLRRDGWLHLYSVRHAAVGGDIERSALGLADAIDRIRRESGAPAVDVIAHSMGGLVARACLRARGTASGIGRLVTLGTPHQGTLAFRWLGLDPMLREMRPGSALFRRLAGDDGASVAECISIYSADDALVVPASAAYQPGALNVEVRGLGHMSLLFSARVYELVRENLAVPPPAGRSDRAGGPAR
jgi:triacylglycerol esterase/lipase EstA (alpha/beta hydrolase family)